MTSSSGSTTRNRVALLGAALLSGGFVLSGCAPKTAPPPHIVNGYVSLPALVRTRPGWAGLAQYDAALTRLDRTARTLPAAGTADPKLVLLPALPPGSAQSAGTVQGAVGTAQRLAAVQASLTGTLDERRRMARAEQVRRQQALWRREARRLFPAASNSGTWPA